MEEQVLLKLELVAALVLVKHLQARPILHVPHVNSIQGPTDEHVVVELHVLDEGGVALEDSEGGVEGARGLLARVDVPQLDQVVIRGGGKEVVLEVDALDELRELDSPGARVREVVCG